jgi:hypothetical protein
MAEFPEELSKKIEDRFTALETKVTQCQRRITMLERLDTVGSTWSQILNLSAAAGSLLVELLRKKGFKVSLPFTASTSIDQEFRAIRLQGILFVHSAAAHVEGMEREDAERFCREYSSFFAVGGSKITFKTQANAAYVHTRNRVEHPFAFLNRSRSLEVVKAYVRKVQAAHTLTATSEAPVPAEEPSEYDIRVGVIQGLLREATALAGLYDAADAAHLAAASASGGGSAGRASGGGAGGGGAMSWREYRS